MFLKFFKSGQPALLFFIPVLSVLIWLKYFIIHQPVAILLTARAAGLPGLSRRLADSTGLDVEELPLAAAAAGAHQYAHLIVAPGPALPLITDLGEAVESS